MCTGRIDPAIVAKAFRKGLDGLLVVGCYFGDCHYISGNVQAKAKVDMTRRQFKHIGINEARLAFRQCSSGEASVYVDIVTRFDQKIRDLGPIGVGGYERQIDLRLLRTGKLTLCLLGRLFQPLKRHAICG